MDSKTKRRQPTPEEIRFRAYEIFLARGGRPGDPESDWLQAERELIAGTPSPLQDRAGSPKPGDGHHEADKAKKGPELSPIEQPKATSRVRTAKAESPEPAVAAGTVSQTASKGGAAQRNGSRRGKTTG
jgi:hypothetical protein